MAIAGVFAVCSAAEFSSAIASERKAGMKRPEAAIFLARKENQPRYESIKWYLSVIRMETPFNDVIKTINAIPKLY